MPGRTATIQPLILITGDDFEWYYEYRDDQGNQVDFPTGVSLYYVFNDNASGNWADGTQWTFSISGHTASILMQSDTADLMAARTPYLLVWKDSSTTPTIEHVLAEGNVERQEPKP